MRNLIQRMGALLSLFCVALTLHAQMHEPIKCETSWEVVSDGVAELRIAATIEAGWHLYSTELEDGPTAATLVVETIEGARLLGKLGNDFVDIVLGEVVFAFYGSFAVLALNTLFTRCARFALRSAFACRTLKDSVTKEKRENNNGHGDECDIVRQNHRRFFIFRFEFLMLFTA